MYNDLTKELGQNFIEYAVAVNSDRAIPDAKSGLKPVAKRIIYGTFDQGHSSAKPFKICNFFVVEVSPLATATLLSMELLFVQLSLGL